MLAGNVLEDRKVRHIDIPGMMHSDFTLANHVPSAQRRVAFLPSSRVVLGRHCAYIEPTDGDVVSRLDLGDRRELEVAHVALGSRWYDQLRTAIELAQRPSVEMIDVRVRNQNGLVVWKRPASPAAKRIDQESRVSEADQCGCMTKPSNCGVHKTDIPRPPRGGGPC